VQVERLAAQDARDAFAALDKELSCAMTEACTAKDRQAHLDRQLITLQGEMQRVKMQLDMERKEAQEQRQASVN
jgi:hypothetical protein